MSKPTDPLAVALAALNGRGSSGQLRVDAVFGERADVLQAIRDARHRKPPASYKAIARLLSADGAPFISEGAVQNWCNKEALP